MSPQASRCHSRRINVYLAAPLPNTKGTGARQRADMAIRDVAPPVCERRHNSRILEIAVALPHSAALRRPRLVVAGRLEAVQPAMDSQGEPQAGGLPPWAPTGGTRPGEDDLNNLRQHLSGQEVNLSVAGRGASQQEQQTAMLQALLLAGSSRMRPGFSDAGNQDFGSAQQQYVHMPPAFGQYAGVGGVPMAWWPGKETGGAQFGGECMWHLEVPRCEPKLPAERPRLSQYAYYSQRRLARATRECFASACQRECSAADVRWHLAPAGGAGLASWLPQTQGQYPQIPNAQLGMMDYRALAAGLAHGLPPGVQSLPVDAWAAPVSGMQQPPPQRAQKRPRLTWTPQVCNLSR